MNEDRSIIVNIIHNMELTVLGMMKATREGEIVFPKQIIPSLNSLSSLLIACQRFHECLSEMKLSEKENNNDSLER